MSFLKDKLKDWCYQASIQKNMKRLRGEPLSDRDHGGPNQRVKGHISPDCPQKRGDLRKFKATEDILDAVYYGVLIYQFEDLPSYESVYEEEIETDRVDLQPSQNSYNEEDRFQTTESLSGFFSRMTVSNKTMERIMHQDSNLGPYDGFRIGEIGRVLNQIGLNQRKHDIIYKVSSGEFAIPMELAGNVMEMQLIPKEEILEKLSKLREEVVITMKWIHIGTIEVVIKATFKEGIDSEIHLSIIDRIINNLRDGCLGTMIVNLYAGKLMFDIHFSIAYNLADQDFSRGYFKRKDLMKEGDDTRPVRIPRIGGVDIVIKDRPILDRTLSSKIEFGSRMSFLEDMITGYRGKEKELIKYLLLKRQPVIGRYEGTLEIAGHEILVAGIAGRENGSMTLGLNFLEDHKPWGRKGIELQDHIVEKIFYFSDELKDKKHLQSFLGDVNFAGIFIKDLAKYRKDFRPLLKEIESSK
ncbi:UNVERIFIED_CONTAM: movement protein [Sesamum latifolium]|uniref:Movement protein n=1 Tax=Sesamum latifolium TaxID=2727402 RepID=A0AAW2SIQ5_9LAMI